MTILIPVIVLSILGLVFGLLLSVASVVFAVVRDPKIDEIKEVLPGANCGGCGKAGCDALAEAIACGEAAVNACPVGGADCAKAIAAIMGQEVSDKVPDVAWVACNGCKEECAMKYEYYGNSSCKEVHALMGGPKVCAYGCIGDGACVEVCKFDAIRINERGVAEVDRMKCTSCGMCMAVCPTQIISLMPQDKEVFIACSSRDKGKTVKEYCPTGCITCGICAKKCPQGAITINKEKNLPVIDYSKCNDCGTCVLKCPQKTILSHIKFEEPPEELKAEKPKVEKPKVEKPKVEVATSIESAPKN